MSFRDSLGSGKKDAAAWLLGATGASAIVPRMRRRGGSLTILAYHRVFDMGPEDGFPFDPELVSATLEDFRWQMEIVAKNYSPVHLTDAMRAIGENRPLPPRAVAVTFDDGHRDNFTHAFPVLRATGVPATIFLSTQYIGGQGTFWFDEVAYRLYGTARTSISIPSLGMALEIGDIASRRRAAESLLAALKVVPNPVRLKALEELADASGMGTVRDDRSAALTWEQVLLMRDGGVQFGSHTVSHPILSRLAPEELRDELARSRLELERRLAVEVAILAYPVGGETAYDESVVSTARDCGYGLGLTYVPGVNAWPPADAFGLRRLHVERYTTRARFAAMLAFPRIFA